MEKVNRPKRLIRYASHNGIMKGERLKITPRIVGYSFLLALLVTVLIFLLATRTDVEATVLRTPGVLYQEVDGKYQNLYNIKVLNKTFDQFSVHLRLIEPEGEVYMVTGENLNVEPDAIAESAFFVKIPTENVNQKKTDIVVGVYKGDELIEKTESTFLGPEN
jgi:polyferredoxin